MDDFSLTLNSSCAVTCIIKHIGKTKSLICHLAIYMYHIYNIIYVYVTFDNQFRDESKNDKNLSFSYLLSLENNGQSKVFI